jgi:hypothetical protein
LAAAADGELEPADAAWADPHIDRCPGCRRTIRAIGDVAATYAAWSPATAPTWLRAATLAEVQAQEPAVASARRAALSTALVSATLVTAASAALLVGGARSLRPDDVAFGGARLPDVAHSMEMAAIAAAPLVRSGRRHAPAKHPARERLVARVLARASSLTALTPRPAAGPSAPALGLRLEPVPAPRRLSAPPATTVDAPEPASAPPASDAATGALDTPTTTAVAAVVAAPDSPSTGEVPAPQTAASPPPPTPAVMPPPPVPAGSGDAGSRGPCGRGDRRHG